jgi:hypothetical protein
MLADVSKFLNWACAHEEIPDQDHDIEEQQQMSQQNAEEVGQTDGSSREPASVAAPVLVQDTTAATAAAPVATAETQQPDVVSNLTSTLEAGVNSYAPAPVANLVHNQLHPEPTAADLSDSDSSSDSFLSANEMNRFSTAPEGHDDFGGLTRLSTENLSMASAASSSELSKTDRKNLSHHDKEILKITQHREKLDQKLAKQRMVQETKLKQSQEKEESDYTKAREHLEKEMQKTEERHRKDIEKLEARREKELRKAEERRKKRADQDKLSLVARERDEFRSQADLLGKENELLRDQVEMLQRENTALASRLGKVGGPEALKSVQDELRGRSSSHSRAGTVGTSAESVSL